MYGFACIYPAILYEHTAARRLLDLNTNLCFISILPGTMIHDKRLGLGELGWFWGISSPECFCWTWPFHGAGIAGYVSSVAVGQSI